MRVSTPVLVLLAAQTALIFFLSFRMNAVDARIGEIAAAQAEPIAPPIARASASTSPADALTRADIREIVREEFAAAAAEIAAAANNPATEKAPPPRVRDAREIAEIRADVGAELRSFIARGAASPGEMTALQKKIAQLPPGEREKALGELNRAINNGTLDARF